MKPKQKNKSAKAKTKKAVSPPVTPTPTPAQEVSNEPLPPHVLLHLAEEEEDQQLLREYFPVIKALRKKHFSFRGIGDWLTRYGVEADYNDVYRVFMKYCTPEEDAEEEDRERDEALDDHNHGRGEA